MNKVNFDPEELEFRREMDAALAQIRSTAGPCPDPDRLMAVVAGVPLESANAIRQHIALCPVCEQLSRDLGTYEFPGASGAEDRRIRARWRHTAASAHGAFLWNWLWRPLPVAAAIAIVTIAAVIAVRRPSLAPPSNEIAAVHTAPAPVAFALVLQKPGIKVPADSVLTYRGDGQDSQALLKDLAAALEPYRSDNYAEAARRLERLVPKYPSAAAPAFYLGVSQLFLKQNDSAFESLQTARRRPDEALRDDISWYLAVAYERAGKNAEALREAERLCGKAGDYQPRACSGLDQLKQR
jgi:hypothetical protein